MLTRTTRRISATEVGERLYANVASRFEEIDAEVAAVSEMRNKPATSYELAQHNCINLRLPTHGGFLPWDFDRLRARRHGAGASRAEHLVCMLDDWCEPYPGYYFYYPSRLQP